MFSQLLKFCILHHKSNAIELLYTCSTSSFTSFQTARDKGCKYEQCELQHAAGAVGGKLFFLALHICTAN